MRDVVVWLLLALGACSHGERRQVATGADDGPEDPAPATDGGGGASRARVVGADPEVPLVFYTDLASVPPGAFLTIWGRGFGPTKGESDVLLAGRPVERILSWSDRRIELQVPRPASTGELRVRTAAGESPPRRLEIHQGRIFFVAKNGDDDWSGQKPAPTGGDGPFLTLARVPRELRAGDVVYVRAGQYAEQGQFDSVWAFYELSEGGTAEQPIAIVGYPGERAVIGDSRQPRTFSFFRGDDVTTDWITIAKLTLRPACTALELRAMHHGRVVGNEVFGQSPDPERGCGDGTIALQSANGWKILGNRIHDNGYHKMDHAIYLAGFGTNRDVEIAWNHVSEQRGGRAIQFYGHEPSDRIQDVSIHDNEIEDIDRDGILLGGSDGGAMQIQGVWIYNNVVARAGRCEGWGVRVDNPTARGVRVHHNTFVDNGPGDRACFDSPGLRQGSLVLERFSRIEIMNNVFAAVRRTRAIDLPGRAGRARIERNLYWGGDRPPAGDRDAIAADPLFALPESGDYRLREGSPAIDSARLTGLGADHAGVSRPQGGASDLGAFEHVAP